MATISQPYTVLLIEDHALLRAGIRQLIQQHRPDWQVLEAATLQDAREQLPQAQHIILDLSFPDGHGLHFLPEAVYYAPTTILTAFDTPAFYRKALDLGASGFVSKTAHPDILTQTLLAVLPAEPSAQNFTRPEVRSHQRLSSRETEVLQLLGEGLSATELAERLEVDLKTVYTHRRHLMQKLGLADNQALIRYATLWWAGLTHTE